jgi:2-amino-4-hydroxy-6-hydroxymethyldihydropteridine diphosphokinase
VLEDLAGYLAGREAHTRPPSARSSLRPARLDALPTVGPAGLTRRRAFLGLGSNLGDRLGYLRRAVDDIDERVACSDVYETEPVGGPPGQQPYLNLVVELATERSPRALLELARRLETEAGRVRSVRHGPRTLDVDVLLVGDLSVEEPDLVVPHPRMWERRFVLAPLRQLAPELVPRELLERAVGQVRRLGPF